MTMKKRVKEKGLIRFKNLILPNGVVMQAKSYRNFINLKGEAAVAKTTEDGTMVFHTITDDEDMKAIKEEVPREAIEKAKTLTRFFTSIIASMFWVLHILNIDLYVCRIYLACAIMTLSVANTDSLPLFFLRIFQPEFANMGKLRGAVNMTLNAYYDLQRMPKKEELKDYSRFSARAYLAVPSIMIAIAIPFLFDGYWFLVALAINLVICFRLKNKMYFYILEKIKINVPSDLELDIALTAMEWTLKSFDANAKSAGIITFIFAGDGDENNFPHIFSAYGEDCKLN